jgi:hypothetical protein
MRVKTKQLGNATVETLLIATAMIPFFTGIPLMGKIADINNTTTQASRYLAWEQTVGRPGNPPQQNLQLELQNRFFADPDLQIRSDRQQITGDDAINPMWAGYGFDNDGNPNRLIDQANGPTYQLDNDNPDGLAGSLLAGIDTMGDTMSSFSGGEWDVEAQGLYTGQVSINVMRNAFLAQGVDCSSRVSESITACITRANAIFVDSWDAQNANQAGARARTFVPAGALEPVGNLLARVPGKVPFFRDLGGLQSDENGGFGYVNPNVLPMDRYAED